MPYSYPPRQFASEIQIEYLATGLLACTLPKAEWTHEAHFAATLCLLLNRADIVLELELPELIRRYNLSVGGQNTDTSGYHETLTQLYIGAIRAHARNWQGVPGLLTTANALIASDYADRDFPLRHWRRETLFSVEARRSWRAPDLAPLPFAVNPPG